MKLVTKSDAIIKFKDGKSKCVQFKPDKKLPSWVNCCGEMCQCPVNYCKQMSCTKLTMIAAVCGLLYVGTKCVQRYCTKKQAKKPKRRRHSNSSNSCSSSPSCSSSSSCSDSSSCESSSSSCSDSPSCDSSSSSCSESSTRKVSNSINFCPKFCKIC